MKYAKSIQEYINHNPERKAELNKLRSILLESELEETLKWGMPTYVLNNRNIVGIGAFKNWSVLWFHDGALLKDAESVLVNAQEGKTKGLRQWRFNDIHEINEVIVRQYVDEAILNCKKGRKVKVEKKEDIGEIKFTIPEILLETLKGDQKLADNWDAYTERQRRDISDYINEPKRESTRVNRLKRIVPIIEQGKPLAALWAKR